MSQGDQAQDSGDLTQAQGDLAAAQGDQAETLGDIFQARGGKTQGRPAQGEQAQLITGGEGQTQGDQNQTLTGHEGQTSGDQMLSGSPSILTPVNVGGVNVNTTVSCCDAYKKYHSGDFDDEDCNAVCKTTIASLLALIDALSLAVTDPSASLVGFCACGLQDLPTAEDLGSISDCPITAAPESGETI